MKNFQFNKKGFEMSFGLIFAIVAGIFILAIAIYAASRFVSIGEQNVGDLTASKIIAYFEPLETGAASTISPENIVFKSDTQLFFKCNEIDNAPFGSESISFSQKYLGDKYSDRSDPIPIKNKYIFSMDSIEGREINLFSKPFNLGFKVSDLVIVLSNNYCFFKTPDSLKKEIPSELSKIKFEENDLSNCSGIKVCFSKDSKCDITVQGMCSDSDCDFYDYGIVSRRNELPIYYSGNLLYAAIFSDRDIYDCNVKRLMKRFNSLGKVYIKKAELIGKYGCNNAAVRSSLSEAMNFATGIQSSSEISSPGGLYDQVKAVDNVNKQTPTECRLY